MGYFQGRSQDLILTEAKGRAGGLGAEPPDDGGLGTVPPAGSRGRAPGQGIRGAERFSVV